MFLLTLRSSILHVAFLFFVLTRTTLCHPSPSSNSVDGAPWQQSTGSRSMMEEFTYADLPPTIFSPTGRLHSIERIVEAAKTSNNPRANLVMAMNCRDGIVMISTVTLSPYLNTTNNTLFLDSDSIFHYLSPSLVVATAGNAVDGQVLQNKLHQSCQSLIQQCGDEHMVTASQLARYVADQLQVPTQTIGKSKILASLGVLLGNQELWRIDPTGQFWKCQATVVGRNADRAEEALFQRLLQQSKDTNNNNNNNNDHKVDVCRTVQEMSTEDALPLLVECLESLLQPKLQQAGVESIPTKTFWQAIIQDHKSRGSESQPRTIQRGCFLPRTTASKTSES